MDKLESLLESYYGMQDEETARDSAMNIDSSTFNCSVYVSDLLQRQSLPELMAYQNQLVNETRNLDHDMQELVYNNYNKFINATDTIRKMRDSVGEMESAMKRLVTDMTNMGGNSAVVNEHLQENRGKIEKLVGVKRLLVKLEFLFELPVRLRRSMELDAHAQAVRYYTMVSSVLTKYDRIPSIHAIRVEADAIMDTLREHLRQVLKSKRDGAGASSSEVVDAIRLLVQLGEPKPALRTAFLEFQRTRLLHSLRQVCKNHTPPSTVMEIEEKSDASSLLSARSRALYNQSREAKEASHGSNKQAAEPSHLTQTAVLFVKQANQAFLDNFRYMIDLHAELFRSGSVSDDEAQVAYDELVVFTKDIFVEFFNTMKKLLSLPPEDRNIEDESGLLDIAKAVESLITGVRACSRHIREAQLDDRTQEIAESILRCQLESLFAHVRVQFVTRLRELCSSVSSEWANTTGQINSQPGNALKDQLWSFISTNNAAQLDDSDPLIQFGRQLSVFSAEVSTQTTNDINIAIRSTAPLLRSAKEILPDLYAVFPSSVHAMVLNTMGWVASACACLTEFDYPARAEWSSIVTEADIKHKLNTYFISASSANSGSSSHPNASSGTSSTANAGAARLNRNYNGPESSAKSKSASNATSTNSSVNRMFVVNLLSPGASLTAAAHPSALQTYSSKATAHTLDWTLPSNLHPMVPGALASLCLHFAEHGVAAVLMALSTAVPLHTSSSPQGAPVSGEDSGMGSLSRLPLLVKQMKDSASECLRVLALRSSRRLGAVVNAAFLAADWLGSSTGSQGSSSLAIPSPSELPSVLVQEILSIRRVLTGVMLDGNAGYSSGNGGSARAVSAPTSSDVAAIIRSIHLISRPETKDSTSEKAVEKEKPENPFNFMGGVNLGSLGVGMGLSGTSAVNERLQQRVAGILGLSAAMSIPMGLSGSFDAFNGDSHSRSAAFVSAVVLAGVCCAITSNVRRQSVSAYGKKKVLLDCAVLVGCFPLLVNSGLFYNADRGKEDDDGSWSGWAAEAEHWMRCAAFSAEERCVDDDKNALQPAVLGDILCEVLPKVARQAATAVPTW